MNGCGARVLHTYDPPRVPHRFRGGVHPDPDPYRRFLCRLSFLRGNVLPVCSGGRRGSAYGRHCAEAALPAFYLSVTSKQSAQGDGAACTAKTRPCERKIQLSEPRSGEGCESHQVIRSRVWHTRQGVSAIGGFMSRYPMRLMNRFWIFLNGFRLVEERFSCSRRGSRLRLQTDGGVRPGTVLQLVR